MTHAIRAAAVAIATFNVYTQACTDFVLRDALKQDMAISARNMDYNLDMNSDMVKVNRGETRQSLPIYECPDCEPASWDVKYGYLFQDLIKQNVVSDGLNEAGLSVGILVLNHYARFPNFNASDTRPLMGGQSLPEYILGMCADVACARQVVDDLHVVAAQHPMMDLMGGDIPCHFSIIDKEGNHLVIEPVYNKTASPECLGPDHDESNSKMCIYDNNEYKVLTNHPPLEEQIANIKAKEAAAGENWQDYWTSMPGDYFQKPRFERAVFLNRLNDERNGTWIQKVPQLEKFYQLTVSIEPVESEWFKMMREALTAGAEAGTEGVSDVTAVLNSLAAHAGLTEEQLTQFQTGLEGISAGMGKTLGEALYVFSRMDDHLMGHFISQNETFSNPDDSYDAVARAQYIIQANTLPPGSSAELGFNAATCWTVIRDHTNLRYYVRTPGNTGLVYYDLSKMDFTTGEGRMANYVNWDYAYPDLTHKLDSSVTPSSSIASGNCAAQTQEASTELASNTAPGETASENTDSGSSGVPIWSLVLTAILGVAVGGLGTFFAMRNKKAGALSESVTDL